MSNRMITWLKGLGIAGIVMTVCVFIGGACVALPCWTDRTLEFWLTRWSEHAVHVPWILAALATWFSGGLALPVNIVSEIARLCVPAMLAVMM